MVGALFFVLHPSLPADLLDGGGDLMKREVARAQFDILVILEIAQMESDDALGVRANKCGNIRAAMKGMACVEHKMHELRIGLRVERFDLANLRLELPPVIVIGNSKVRRLSANRPAAFSPSILVFS